MEDLEKAACIMMDSPDLVSPQQRHQAEQIFLCFRNTRNPFDLCRQILETSRNPYMLFESAAVIRGAIIREYTLHSKEHVQQLKQYIVHYLLSHIDIPSFVRETLIQSIAIIVKRIRLDEPLESMPILDEVENLVTTGNNTTKALGCSIMMGLMQEYAFTRQSANVGMTIGTHVEAKKYFENYGLQRTFLFVLKLMEELSNPDQKMDPQLSLILGKLLTLAESILHWNFLGHQSLRLNARLHSLINLPMSLRTEVESPMFKPNRDWLNIVMDVNFTQLFFKLYWKVRGDSDLTHHVMNCLGQLASAGGPCFRAATEKVTHFTNFMQCLFMFLSSITMQDSDARGISRIFRKLSLPLSDIFVDLPEELRIKYVEHLTSLTCNFAERAAAEENMLDPEDQMYTEAFEDLLVSWLNGLLNTKSAPHLKDKAVFVFNVWLKCHLSPPHGTRTPLRNEEIATETEPDRVQYKDQINTVGWCARQDPDHCISLLTKLLEEKVATLRQALSQAKSAGLDSSCNLEALEPVYEDLHWLLLIISDIVCDGCTSELGFIPSFVVDHSMKFVDKVDQRANINVLVNPAQMPDTIPGSDTADPIVRLFSAALRLCETESQAINANLTHFISPEVSCSLMYLLKYFCANHLFHDETPHDISTDPLSMALSMSFGKDSEGGAWLLEYTIQYIATTLRHRCSEQALVEDTVAFLISLVNHKDRCKAIVKCNGLQTLVSLNQCGLLAESSTNAQRGLVQGLVMCAAGCNKQQRQEYLGQVLDPQVFHFKAMTMSESFPKNCHNENTRKKILTYIDQFIGTSEGVRVNTADCLAKRMSEVVTCCVRVVEVCHNYTNVVEAVLELFVKIGHKMLSFMSTTDTNLLYQSTVAILTTYAKQNVGKKQTNSQNQEDQWRDLQLMMELLTSLLSKDFIDLSRADHGEETALFAADVSLYGLNIIMPLMNAELLKLPSLGMRYFKMVSFIIEVYPEKMCSLNSDLRKNLYASVHLGLTTLGTDVGVLCLDIIRTMGTFMRRSPALANGTDADIKPFLKIILDLILTAQINCELFTTASSTIYVLIVLHKDEYESLMRSLIESQQEPEKASKLTTAFNDLTKEIKLDATRRDRIKFDECFLQFVATVTSFLMVK